MAELFNRQFAVTVGTTRIATRNQERAHSMLRIAFKVEKSTRREPNKVELSIWNLSEQTRKELHLPKFVPVEIQVGYTGKVFTIFTGDLTYVQSARQGADWVTKLQAGDGTKQLRTARITESFAPGVTIVDVAKRAADKLGLPLGNLLDKINGGSVRGKTDSFPKGYQMSGKAEDELDKVLRTMGFEWSVQDGKLQVAEPGKAVDATIVSLSPDTGLVGSPEKGEKGVIKFRSLMQPDLAPGKTVRLTSRDNPGGADFKIERVVYTGDTFGTDWYIDIEGKPL